MENFTFNEITSESLDIIVKDMPLLPRAEKSIESVSVSGRNGNLHIDNKNFLSRPYTISCLAKNKEKIDDINKTFVGTGILKLSKYPNRYFKATIKNQITFDKYLNILQEFPLQFEIDPIAYSIVENNIEITQNSNIEVGGNIDIFPTIIVNGIGIITVNGYSIEVEESGITIDCDLMNCTLGNLSKNNKVILDEFPHLSVGSNAISLGSGIHKIIIKYREGWI